jgi:hypothetical protein
VTFYFLHASKFEEVTAVVSVNLHIGLAEVLKHYKQLPFIVRARLAQAV